MKIGSTFNHEVYGLLKITGKRYSRMGNKSLWIGTDEQGETHELDGSEKPAKPEKASPKFLKEAAEMFGMTQGPQGEKGLDADEEAIIAAVIPQVLERIRIPEDGEPGEDADNELIIRELLPLVMEKMPKPEKMNEASIVSKVLSRIRIPHDGEPGKPGKDGSPDTPTEVKEKLETLKGDERLDASAIKNLPKPTMQFGGGDSYTGLAKVDTPDTPGNLEDKIIAGANITVTKGTNADGTKKLTIAGSAGGSGSPGGADTQVQFNDGGAFGGISTLTYDKVGDSLLGAVTGDMSIFGQTSAALGIGADDSRIEFTGSTVDFYVDADNAFNLVEYTAGKKAIVDVSLIATTDKTFTLPNSTGTFALLEAGQAFTADIRVPDEAYGAGWNGSMEVPTKNALYDKIETLGGGSGITRSIVVTSGSATMGSTASTDYVYQVAGAHTMSLPAASGNTNLYTVKNKHSANITIDTAGAETIEGAASISIAPDEAVDIYSDGTNWQVK